MVKKKAAEVEEVTGQRGSKMSNKDFIKTINKRFGEGSIYTMEGDMERVKVQPIPTGIPSLDYALGVGGFPMGRMIEIYGPESSGKTTLTLYTSAQYQKLARTPGHPEFGRKVAFIDVENSLDPVHAKAIGVDISEENGMIIAQPDSAEQAYDLVHALINSGEVGLVIVDSLAAMVPQKVIDNSAEDNTIGLAARLNGEQMKKMLKPMRDNVCTVVFINQIREKVGVMYGKVA